MATDISILTGIFAILVTLLRISWRMGQLVQQFNDHVISDDKIQADHENRIRSLENRGRWNEYKRR